jgi:thymidylate synthase
MLEHNDLGPVYGWQWRNFNKAYANNEPNRTKNYGHYGATESEAKAHAMEVGDQFDAMIHTLKSNPDDRRMIVNAWNPLQLDQMALPPCHFEFVIIHINGTLNLNWTQRSVDSYLGLPSNLASYAALLLLICKETGMKPGTLTGNLCDVHIYENHLEQVDELVSRVPYLLPRLEFNNWINIYNWDARADSELIGYQSHPELKAPVAI